jgi:hypothetical protein
MTDFPFLQYIDNNKLYRTFPPDIDSDELKWHKDLKDRKIRVINSGGWEYQVEDELPILLEDNMVFEIPKDTWHRVIAGHEKLLVEIEELD